MNIVFNVPPQEKLIRSRFRGSRGPPTVASGKCKGTFGTPCKNNDCDKTTYTTFNGREQFLLKSFSVSFHVTAKYE